MTETQRALAELAAELGESAFDYFLSKHGADAFASVPILGVITKLGIAFQDVRARMLAKKLACFLSEPSLIDAINAQKLRNSMENEAEMQRVGETALMVLDQITDTQKPVLAARIIAAFLNGRIDSGLALRYLHVISQSYTEDLLAFVFEGSFFDEVALTAPERLHAVGFFKSITAWDQVNFEPTVLGLKFREAIIAESSRQAPGGVGESNSTSAN